MGTGGVAGAFQLASLAVLTRHGWEATAANALAFLAAAQVNFALSLAFTWRDRHPEGTRSGSVARRWLLFHGSIAAMALLNMLVFTLARAFVPALVASALGILAGAAGNYLAGDRIVFRGAGPDDSTSIERSHAA
jgi:putative flippase GtrA